MNNNQPLNRRVEISIGPLAEWEGGGPEESAIRIYGDGTSENLRIKFSIPKHIVSTSSPTTISIYNLSPGTRGALQTSEAQVSIKVGWDNVGLISVFKGSLMAVVSRRDNADIVTDLLCIAAMGATSKTTVSKAFGEQYPLSTMLVDIAKELPGVDVDPKLIDVVDFSTGTQGYSFAGAATDLLDKLARVHGFSWWINNGVFHALDDNKTFNEGSVVISSDNGFLKTSEPMLSTPWQKQVGVTVESLLNPFVIPGGSISLTSKINTALSGLYKVHLMTHAGDTHADEWTTSIQSYLVGDANG